MKNIVNSKDNKLVKEINRLRLKKYRKQTGYYIIESKKMIDEAIKSNIKIKNIIIREDVLSLYEDEIVFNSNLFNSVSTLVTPDGYMAIVEKDRNQSVTNRVLILDKLQDPGNLGALIRSSEAFGFDTIISIDSVDFFNDKVLRASMGSIFRLNLIELSYTELDEYLDHEILIADMDGEDYRNLELPDKIALVIGNEGRGISDDILKFDHKRVKIPMLGEIESLNAAVSGSIMMSRFSKE